MKILSKEKIVATITLIILSMIFSPMLYANDLNMALVNEEDKADGAEVGIESLGDVISSFPAPASRPWGLAWDDPYLWLSSEGDDTIYKLDSTTGFVVDSFPAPTTFPTGLTFDGQYLWLAEYGSTIYKIDPGTGSVVFSFPSPTTVSGWTDGLTFDGVNLWVTGFADPMIYKVDPATGMTVGTIPAPGGWSRDITWDGTNLWVVDTNPDGEIYQISPADGSILSSFTLPSVGFPVGITFDGQYLRVSGLSDNMIYQVDIEFEPWILQQDISYIAGTLNLNYTLGSPAPSIWATYLILPQPPLQFIPLWTLPLPEISPPLPIPLSFPFPSIGTIGFLTILHDGVTLQAFDIDWVVTSGPVHKSD